MGAFLYLHDVAYDHPKAMEELEMYRKMEKDLENMAAILKCDIFSVADKVEKLILRINELQHERDKLGGL